MNRTFATGACASATPTCASPCARATNPSGRSARASTRAIRSAVRQARAAGLKTTPLPASSAPAICPRGWAKGALPAPITPITPYGSYAIRARRASDIERWIPTRRPPSTFAPSSAIQISASIAGSSSSAATSARGRPCSRPIACASASNSSMIAWAILRMYRARSPTRSSAHSGCTCATARTTSSICPGGVDCTLPSNAPVAGLRDSIVSGACASVGCAPLGACLLIAGDYRACRRQLSVRLPRSSRRLRQGRSSTTVRIAGIALLLCRLCVA